MLHGIIRLKKSARPTARNVDGINGVISTYDDCSQCGGDGSTCGDCDGNNGIISEIDCTGVCGGGALVDCGGVCQGPGIGSGLSYGPAVYFNKPNGANWTDIGAEGEI